MKVGSTSRGKTFTISRRGLITGLNIANERAWKSEIRAILKAYRKWKNRDGLTWYDNFLRDAVKGDKNYNALFYDGHIDIGCCRFYTEDIENISKLLKL